MAETAIVAGTKPRKASTSREEKKQLLIHHMTLLRAKHREVQEAREPLKTAQEEFTALVNDAKGDLGKGYTRKHLMSLLEDSTSRLRDLLREEEQRAFDREALGLPVFGVQVDLFEASTAKMPAEARDEVHYEAEGFMRGRAGLLEVIPEGTPPRFHQAIQRGYEKGQELTRSEVQAAMELKKRQAEPDAGAEAKNLNAAPEPGTPEAEEAERKSITRAKASLQALGDPANQVAA